MKVRYWKIYVGKDGRYRARARARNGRKVFGSTQGYVRRWDACWNAIKDGGAPLSILKQQLGVEVKVGA